MRYASFWLLAASIVLPSAATAQSVPALSAGQVRFFVSFLERVGSADVDPALLSHNEAGVSTIFSLNASEAAALHLAAMSYRKQMTAIRQTENALIAGKSGLSSADLATIAQLVQTRNGFVAAIAASFLASLRAEVLTRVLSDAQQTIDFRNAKGIN